MSTAKPKPKPKPEERPITRRLRAPARREQILESALTVFAEHGYEASMGEVADASGVTRSVLYYYFPGKRDLFLAVLHTQTMALLGQLAPIVASAGQTEQERIRKTADATLAFASENPLAWKLMFAQPNTNERDVLDASERAHELGMAAATAMVGPELERLGIDPRGTRARMIAEMCFGALLSLARWWDANPSVPREEVADAIAAMLWGGLSGSGDR